MEIGQRTPDGFQEPDHIFLGRGEDAERADVGPDGHEARVSQREHAGKAVDEIQGNGQNGVDGHEVQELGLVAVEILFGQPETAEEEEDGQGGGKAVAQAVAGILLRGHQILSSSFSPMSPVGLKSNMAMRRTKAKASR